ncbi:hypothetical protein KNU78_gp62 [Gordonia phage Sukkupi]|uniref:Uncharacterized protein n=1 Tax=Gordonia phage Sukkupi TaxID=2653747 RepID=A0A5Q2WJ12_9CAUD|nr:hypothetical protein KNU78_gp62 [Gordonia phage Sukkupi]QGH79305.1 hypothetical protein SEA_SUKKUPI_62 [Gordonia phage Sukkupi]QGH80778.1 hypothetical protein SEA_YNDEXA_62 [Gordonia phage Yndexa]
MAQHERTGRVGEVTVHVLRHGGPRSGRHRKPEITAYTNDPDAFLRESQAAAARSKLRVLRG